MAKKKIALGKRRLHFRDVETIREFLGETADLDVLSRSEERELLKIVKLNQPIAEMVDDLRLMGIVIKDVGVMTWYNAWFNAREELVRKNLRWIAAIANRFTRFVSSSDIGDLLQSGVYGLMAAIDRFELWRGTRLGTYATWWIRRSFQEFVASNTNRTLHFVQELLKLKKARAELLERLKREPSVLEIAEYLGRKKDAIFDLIEMERELVSLDSPVANHLNDSDKNLEEFVADDRASSAFEVLAEAGQSEFVISRLDVLGHRDKNIMMMRYGLGKYDRMSLKQIGKHFHLTRQRINQVIDKSLTRLRGDKKLALLVKESV